MKVYTSKWQQEGSELATIDGEEMIRLLAKKACSCVVEVILVNTLNNFQEKGSKPPEIVALLEQYSDVFEEPNELSPTRECDHAIFLIGIL